MPGEDVGSQESDAAGAFVNVGPGLGIGTGAQTLGGEGKASSQLQGFVR